MAKTSLLPPVTAIRMVWAMTGKFSSDQPSQAIAAYVESELQTIQDESKTASAEELGYTRSTITTMKASLRTLDTVFKCRELNFEENEQLRAAYLTSVNESIQFGTKAKDFIKSLPTMTIGTAGGVTLASALHVEGLTLWALGLALAALGYVVNLIFVYMSRKQTQQLYITQDYERGLYYDQYIHRVNGIMLSLFLDIERIHKKSFGENYEPDVSPTAMQTIINGVLSGVHTSLCLYAHKHMQAKKITPALWAICESGSTEATHICKYWEGKRELPQTNILRPPV